MLESAKKNIIYLLITFRSKKVHTMTSSSAKFSGVRIGSFKTIFYIAILVLLLSVTNFLFGWASFEEMPTYLQPYNSILLLVHPYLSYIQAGLIFIFGYLVVNAVSGLVYAYMRRATDHPTAATVRTITRISGIAVLLSLMTSVFNVNPAAALTVGSIGGLVVGFATQTILQHVVAGVFLLISRPFTYGDAVTISGQSGVVKEIKLMHLVLESDDGTKDILIPSGTVVSQIIHKKNPPAMTKHQKTLLTLDPPSSRVSKGSIVTFTGRLLEASTGNPIPGKTIKICDRDPMSDDLLASGATQTDGCFSINWTAKKTDRWDNTAEIYAKFEGDQESKKSESNQYVITIES